VILIVLIFCLLGVISPRGSGKRYSKSACTAMVLTEDVPDNCPSGNLTGTRCGRSTYTAMSVTEGTYFLATKRGSF